MKNPSYKHSLLKKVVCVFLAVLLIFVAGSVIGSAAVFYYVFRRAEYSRVTELEYRDIDAAKYPRESVAFESGKNTLQGYLYVKDNAAGTVIIVNGIFSGADRHLGEIMFFYDHGWQVFAFDGTGVGSSEGESIVGLQQTRQDLEAAAAALKKDGRVSSLPIVLYGHSAGGYASITALKTVPEIAAAVSVAGFDSPVETMHYHARQLAGQIVDIEYPFLWLQNVFLFGKDANIRASDVLADVDVPVMVIEGSGDTVIPSDIGIAKFCERCENPKVIFCLIDEPYRNAHNTMWLSAAAAKAFCETESEKNEASPSLEERLLMNEVDVGFMETVLDFYNAAINK